MAATPPHAGCPEGLLKLAVPHEMCFPETEGGGPDRGLRLKSSPIRLPFSSVLKAHAHASLNGK